MKCIDAIEGTAKAILKKLHQIYAEEQLDDSEYIRNVKAVLDATDQYVVQNPEVAEGPQLLREVLYVYSRNLWLMEQHPVAAHTLSQSTVSDAETDDYQTYYYDFVFNNGNYPK